MLLLIALHNQSAERLLPHHENEIAQSEGANDCTFVNTWMHVGFVNINNEKMSKSLGDYIRALISRLYDVQDKSGLFEVFYEKLISTRKI
jgi:cysteinyl-tRNA synthetase